MRKYFPYFSRLVPRAVLLTSLLFVDVAAFGQSPRPGAAPGLAFTVAGDMRSFTENPNADGKRFFDGACEAMRRVGPGAFLISPGDFDPPAANRAVIDKYLGAQFPWYVVVGNHEVENSAAMPWVREWLAADIPHMVRRGLRGTTLTVYSFDVENSHFIAIDSYPMAKAGKPDGKGKVAPPGDKGRVDLTETEFQWIEADLAATKKAFVWVIGHQPIQSMPDMDSGRARHGGDSVSYDPTRAARFAALLKKHKVRAYLCGHTHNTSVTKLSSGVWQADSGHARGGGDPGAPSTFLKIRTAGDQAWVDIYRADPSGVNYQLRATVALD
jgi:3',5'-cyclic AMP phosphodiesterase CpdA